jgi:hypothetical protein
MCTSCNRSGDSEEVEEGTCPLCTRNLQGRTTAPTRRFVRARKVEGATGHSGRITWEEREDPLPEESQE